MGIFNLKTNESFTPKYDFCVEFKNKEELKHILNTISKLDVELSIKTIYNILSHQILKNENGFFYVKLYDGPYPWGWNSYNDHINGTYKNIKQISIEECDNEINSYIEGGNMGFFDLKKISNFGYLFNILFNFVSLKIIFISKYFEVCNSFGAKQYKDSVINTTYTILFSFIKFLNALIVFFKSYGTTHS